MLAYVSMQAFYSKSKSLMLESGGIQTVKVAKFHRKSSKKKISSKIIIETPYQIPHVCYRRKRKGTSLASQSMWLLVGRLPDYSLMHDLTVLQASFFRHLKMLGLRVSQWSRSSKCPDQSVLPGSIRCASAPVFGRTYRHRASHENADTPSTKA